SIPTTVGPLLRWSNSAVVGVVMVSPLEAISDHRGPGRIVKNLDFTTRGEVTKIGVMRTYGQYCPIARGAEIFAERWTPLIIRNLYLGCGSFSEILEGAPGLSRTLLSQRLKRLERLGIVESSPKPDGRGRHYALTPAGHHLFKVFAALGEWGAAWLERSPEHLYCFVPLCFMADAVRQARL